MDAAFAPRTFNASFIALSYVISYMGSLTTLELLQLRTSRRGLYNWYLLFGGSVSMGGIAIWSMHFVGNRAIVLYDGEDDLQLSYSPGYTALSFFVPIAVLMGAYLVGSMGAEESSTVSLPWLALSGLGAGLSITAMHYLGNAGISNYSCVYTPGYVVGSVFIALFSTGAALTTFFMLRKNFTNVWWKRIPIAAVLACGVSGMHWCAVMGTKYVSNNANNTNELSRSGIVILTIVFSVISCVALLVVGIVAGRGSLLRRGRSQKVMLMAATFDDQGRIMVLPDGTLPAVVITDGFKEKSFKESFGPRHSVFHWLYRTSQNWDGVTGLLDGMRKHVGSQLGNSQSVGSAYDVDYSVLFREMFCLAAQDLAIATRRPLSRVGVLHDEMLSTGTDTESQESGKVLFLASRLEKSAAASSGLRFVSPDNVLEILQASMQVSLVDISRTISAMQTSTQNLSMELPSPGIYIACFALRKQQPDYDILVNAQSTHLLPMLRLQSDLDTSDSVTLDRLAGKTVSELIDWQADDDFGKRFQMKVLELELFIGDPAFRRSTLEPYIVELGNGVCLILFRTMIASPCAFNDRLKFIPFSFFNTQQRCYPGSPDHDTHARKTYREFSGLFHGSAAAKKKAHHRWTVTGERRGSFSSSTSEKNLVVESNTFLNGGIMVSQSVTIENRSRADGALEMNNMGPSAKVARVDDGEMETWAERLWKQFGVMA